MTQFNYDLELPKSKANKYNFRVLLNFIQPQNVDEINKFLTVYPGWTQHIMEKLCFAQIFQFLVDLQTAYHVVVKYPATSPETFDFALNFDESTDVDLYRLKRFFASLEFDFQAEFSEFMDKYQEWNQTDYKSIQSLYSDFFKNGNVGEAVKLLEHAFYIKYDKQNCAKGLLKKGSTYFQVLLFVFWYKFQQ